MSYTPLELDIYKCFDCPLSKAGYGRVAGKIPSDAKIAIVIDYPTKQEGKMGMPLVDLAGEMVNQSLADAGIDRNKIAILHCIKCVPPQKREPVEFEALLCREWIRIQLCQIKPKMILAMGELALATLLEESNGILTPIGLESRRQNFEQQRKTVSLVAFPSDELALLCTTYSPSDILIRENKEGCREKIKAEIHKDIVRFGEKCRLLND